MPIFVHRCPSILLRSSRYSEERTSQHHCRRCLEILKHFPGHTSLGGHAQWDIRSRNSYIVALGSALHGDTNFGLEIRFEKHWIINTRLVISRPAWTDTGRNIFLLSLGGICLRLTVRNRVCFPSNSVVFNFPVTDMSAQISPFPIGEVSWVGGLLKTEY